MTDLERILLDLKLAIEENVRASLAEDDAKNKKIRAHLSLNIAQDNLRDFTRNILNH